jgi:hypothetical protein
MKALTLSLLAILGLAGALQSQAPAAPKTPLQQLQDLKAKNKELIEKQAATLQKLDALQKDAQSIKFLGKRV